MLDTIIIPSPHISLSHVGIRNRTEMIDVKKNKINGKKRTR
jgi:hypothetical protein